MKSIPENIDLTSECGKFPARSLKRTKHAEKKGVKNFYI